jgi:PIN domain nuclease of toxin-antitoxin system
MSKSTTATDGADSSARTLIDASTLMALLGAEPAAGEVQELVNRGAATTTVSLAETVDRLTRRYDLEIDRIRTVIEGLLEESLTLLPLEAPQAWGAGEIRAAHYHRSRSPISLADAVLIASASAGGRIASSDAPLLTVAEREGIATAAPPDSKGRRASAR